MVTFKSPILSASVKTPASTEAQLTWLLTRIYRDPACTLPHLPDQHQLRGPINSEMGMGHRDKSTAIIARRKANKWNIPQKAPTRSIPKTPKQNTISLNWAN